MMKNAATLLGSSLLSLAFVVSPAAIAPGKPQPAGIAAPGSNIQQFSAGSHILGFRPDSVYLVNTAGFLSVRFLGTQGGLPVPDSQPPAPSHRRPDRGRPAPFTEVTYSNLWPGISLTYEPVKDAIAKSTYVVKPGADPADIRLEYNARTTIQKDGSLRIDLPTARGWMTESRPAAWQEIEGQRRPVEVAFRIEAGQVGFEVADYDRTRDLVIDPTYQWHAFFGSTDIDVGFAITLDGSGNVFVTGISWATWNGPGATAPLNAFSGSGQKLFVLKLNSNGVYQWHTFYGGAEGADQGSDIASDASGNVYVAGVSSATWNGPGGAAPLNPHVGGGTSTDEIVVLKLNTSGAYQWHTFYGSSLQGQGDIASAIAVDGSGNVYVGAGSGRTWNGPGGIPPLNPHNEFLGNRQIVVLKLNTNGAYQWHTFYGSATDSDFLHGIALDGSSNIYTAGLSLSTWNGPGATPPLNPGGSGIFVLKLNTSGAYQWHTFYGSGSNAEGIAVDAAANVYVAGDSDAAFNGPGGAAPLNPYSAGSDIVVVKLNSSGTYQWHTFYATELLFGIALDAAANVYVSGVSGASWNGPGGGPCTLLTAMATYSR